MSKKTKKAEKKKDKKAKKAKKVLSEVNDELLHRVKEEKPINSTLIDIVKDIKTSEDHPLSGTVERMVAINKHLIDKDKRAIQDWQETYYQDLFAQFKDLVRRHNEVFQFKAEGLDISVKEKQAELRKLEAEIKLLEAEVKLHEAQKEANNA